jgi:hypothetical protein
MVFTNAGKNRVRDLLSADIDYGQVGTSNTAATFADTALLAGVAATSSAVSNTTADKQIVSDYTLGASLAIGSTLSEYGLTNSSGTLLARFVMASLTKTSTEQWQLSTRLFID